VQPLQIGHDLRLRTLIECRQRLVHQQQLRVDQQGAPDGHPLPLPSREFCRIPFQHSRKPQPLYHLIEADPPGGWRQPPVTVFEIAAYGEMRKQARLLENVTDRPLFCRQKNTGGIILPERLAMPHRPRMPLEPGHGAQQGCLAGAGVTEQHRHPLIRNGQIHIEAESAMPGAEAHRNPAHAASPRPSRPLTR